MLLLLYFYLFCILHAWIPSKNCANVSRMLSWAFLICILFSHLPGLARKIQKKSATTTVQL